jgi:oxygen-independent coproporphyrinogen-3 oxidase
MSLSIYLHIPFCKRLCPYCHFYRVPEIPDWSLYLGAVTRELDALEKEPAREAIHTLYVGGGTPTLLPPEFYRSLFESIGDRFNLAALAEGTMETDGEVSFEELAQYAQAGFDRVSVGVKSFDPRIRKILGVGGLLEPDPVASARSAGFSSVGLDLIYGIEDQTLEDLVGDLERTVNLEPDHISLYMLEGPETGGPDEGDPDLAAAMFRESARVLGAAGYRQYEITNFARPGRDSLHNTVYWEDGNFIGLGPSAHSAVTVGGTVDGTRVRWRNRPDIEAYLKDPLSCREELSREGGTDRAREALILGLRMTKGVHRPTFARRYGSDPMEFLKPHLGELMELGLIRFSADRVRLTTRGMLLSNEVFVRILE